MPVQRRSPLRVAGVDGGALLEQDSDDLLVAAFRRQVQRRLTGVGLRIDLGSCAQEQLRHLELPVTDRHVQRCSARVVPIVYVGASVNKKLGDVTIIIADLALSRRRRALADGAMQRCLPVLVNGFGVGSELQE